jgi:hypothetical protein
MTQRTFNYTGRKKITDLRIRIEPSEFRVLELVIPPASINGFAMEDRIWLESRRPGSLEGIRFSLGTVGSLVPVRGLDYRPLGCSIPAFMLKITDGREPGGRLAGVSADINVELAEVPGGRSLLGVSVDNELRDRAWRLVFDTTGPMLHVSGLIPKAAEYAASSVFTALVLPDVLRQILHRICIENEYFETGSKTDWRAKWLRCASDMRGDDTLPVQPSEGDDAAREAVEDWIDDAITAFNERSGLLDRLVSELGEDAE